MIWSLALGYALLLAALLNDANSKSAVSELIPSLCWALLVVLPFTLMNHQFIPDYVPDQAFGVFIFGFLLLAADAWSVRMVPQSSQTSLLYSNRNVLRAALFLVAVIWSVQIAHLLLMPKIPLLEVLKDTSKSEADQIALREQSSKLLRVPFGLTYLFQISWCLLAPWAIFLLVELRRYRLATAVFLSTALYSRLTLARGPIFVLTAMVLIGLTAFLTPMWKKRAFSYLSAAFVIVLIPLTIFFLTDPLSVFNFPAQPTQAVYQNHGTTPSFTLNDHYRDPAMTAKYATAPRWKVAANYLVYRVFLVPVEVSHRWYHYYPHVYGRFLGTYGMTPGQRKAENFRHPANLVGLWAYRSRFPNIYHETIHAYAGVDADSFSRWGRWGILATALLTVLLRLGLNALQLSGNFGAAMNRCALVLLGVTLPIASLPAIFVAQGIGLYLSLLAVLYLARKLGRGFFPQRLSPKAAI